MNHFNDYVCSVTIKIFMVQSYLIDDDNEPNETFYIMVTTLKIYYFGRIIAKKALSDHYLTDIIYHIVTSLSRHTDCLLFNHYDTHIQLLY